MVARWELEKGEVEIRCVPFFCQDRCDGFHTWNDKSATSQHITYASS